MKPWILRIRKLMQERDMTQESLAEELGRGQSWVNHKLSGRRKVNVEDIVLIAQALDVTPAALINNITSYEKFEKNVLGVAEPKKEFVVSRLGELENRLNLLDEKERQKLLEEFEQRVEGMLANGENN